jgi:hypothetical protein
MAAEFIKKFDTTSESHVMWLKRMMDVAENMRVDTSINLLNEINNNPMKINLQSSDALSWPQIHFSLCGLYTKSVLKGGAWIPKYSK